MSKIPESVGLVEWRAFLKECPPGTRATIENNVVLDAGRVVALFTPELQFFCDANCQELRYCDGSSVLLSKTFYIGTRKSELLANTFCLDGGGEDWLLRYACQKCKIPVKTFAMRISKVDMLSRAQYTDATKVGEWPRFAPSVPDRLMQMCGSDRDLFLKGREAEISGLGIGAFAYYRQMLESQKSRLIDQVIKAAKTLSTSDDKIALLEKAKTETQFKKAIDSIKEVIPKELFVAGENPFTLLYSALSKGIHDMTDAECLQRANDIRVILTALTVRIGEVMQNQQELKAAVSRLRAPKSSS